MEETINVVHETTKIIRDYYDANVEAEWTRIANRPEFLLTCRMLDRYIKPSQKVLDIGGGPGRYSLYLASRGCDVTLFDLSPQNTKFAASQALEQGLTLKTITGDACKADELTQEKYDHILLMGPMYHLLEEYERVQAVNAALNLLVPGGIIYVSFINMMGGIIYSMKESPEILMSNDPSEVTFIQNFIDKKSYKGNAFTQAFFIEQSEILPFMSQFPLTKLHMISQEGVLSPCESNIMSQSHEIINKWLDLCEKIWEREEFQSWAEHLLYVGRKIT
ncbi:MAG: class I SAM-dependent methyltransferase [Defluviitaleaceae bacterium]|nr:class I SAM-dependent methyltransferase [Defluviitaleaceae bacterium]